MPPNSQSIWSAVRYVVPLCLALLCSHTAAQQDDIGEVLKRVSPAEELALRKVLAEPVPTDTSTAALQTHLQQKQVAGEKLGDVQALLALYRQWETLMPSTLPHNNFAIELARAGETQEGLRIRRAQLAAMKPGIRQEHVRVNYVGDLYSAGHIDEAIRTLALARANIDELNTQSWSGLDRVYLLRAQARALMRESQVQAYFGRKEAAVQWANTAVELGRSGLQSTKALSRLSRAVWEKEVGYAAGDVAIVLNQLAAALQEMGNYSEADQALRELLRLANEVALAPRYFNQIYVRAASLRFDQREFAAAQRYYQHADQLAVRQGLSPTSPARVNLARLRIAALAGQHRWADALGALERLDSLAKDDVSAAKRMQMAFERGYAYLGSNTKIEQAAQLYQQLAADLSKRYPLHHFYLAQAQGLQGVALWKTGTPSAQMQARTLLQEAVRDYMRPDNLDFETVGLRSDVRELIFATALEAAFAQRSQNSMDMMGPADWVRGGIVQDALVDAAERSAATTPALAELVRSDQDAKNEIEALRKALATDGATSDAQDNTSTSTSTNAGVGPSPSRQVMQTMRSRVSELEAARKKLQADIQAQFPDFAHLLRPTPPAIADLAKALAQDEVLLMLLPTDKAVYVWAVTHSGAGLSAKVALPKEALHRLVKDLRLSLDFNQMGGRMAAFNAVAASALYQSLLVPVQAALAGKGHIIVAAGGALGQIPFGLLLTQATKNVSADAPWLIKQAAITHVPSLSAWLAVKKFAKSPSAPEALAAWGDPVFGVAKPSTAAPVAVSGQARLVDLELDDPAQSMRYADIPALPETRDELLAIAAALHADPARDLHLGTAATKASVLQSSKSAELLKKKVIVFATHGLMAGDLPRLTQPALALAATGLEGQAPLGALLTLDEVLSLKLNADWVVLSACNTAAGDGKAEEALSGLARGFFYAGSRSLLVTHWPVESQSAMLLTTHTFTHYTTHPEARKADSLRQAMLTVMADKRYAHPAFWAPYALVGDGSR